MRVDQLVLGQAFLAKLDGDKSKQKRIVARIVKRTALTRVETQRSDDKNRREVFELPSKRKVG